MWPEITLDVDVYNLDYTSSDSDSNPMCSLLVDIVLVFSEREREFTFTICRRPSVCLSETFVHPTQAVEIFGNVSTP